MPTLQASPLAFRPAKPDWPRPAPEAAGRVVVVTRTANRSSLLARACQSVLAQSYRHWQLVVVNDGGNAREVEEVLGRYRPVFGQRLRILHQPVSQGRAAAANLGLAAADGEFVALLDDDDTWHPQFLAHLVGFLNDAASADLAGAACHARIVSERMEDGRAVFETECDAYPAMQAVRLDRIMAENPIPSCALLFRKAALEVVGPFNEALTLLEDWELLLRLLAVADIGVVPAPLAFSHRRTNLAGTPYANARGDWRGQREDARLRNALLRRMIADPAAAATVGLGLGLGQSLAEMAQAMDRLGYDKGAGLGRAGDAVTRVEAHLFNLAERYHVHAGDCEARLAALEAHLFNLAERFHSHAGATETRLAALETHLLALAEHSHAGESAPLEMRLTQLEASVRTMAAQTGEIHLWLSVLTAPLRFIWRPLRRAAVTLFQRGGSHAA
ncbi:Glycosyl transferase-like protein [Desulfovibrio sp. DV]|uniref:glycosyltransferase family 2 protein n=1 Tax=Desulfovibrio sp. DV TaxID=1844708 RepID=UPI00094BA98E|nr:glycosyltransferase [Desulfovibrio sp. DV]OLN26219.1 Glycosyl transferase-like protein [Desulfovibrio sp. DV]